MLKKKIIKQKTIILFEDTPVRRIWSNKEEKWYFSVVDVVRILTGSINQSAYWRKLKERLKKEGNQTVTNCHALKMIAPDGKMRLTDVADTETMFRIIQSIPSSKAEPFKIWLARVGYERLQETVNPELSINRARKNWKAVGRSGKWIEQRMRGQEIRNKLTDYWSQSDVKEGLEYAKLTDIIHKEWTGLTTKGHKKIKNLKRENLRDNMTDAELLFTALAELSTTNVAKKDQAKGYDKNAISAKKGGGVAKRAKKDYELQTGQKVVSEGNFLPPIKRVKKLK
ncbi:Bro-N domain-containing protein [Patescibacteria group bacterium]|nr:Bro-N domain-containing protein [Patescibacteria group bacterium]MCG2809256.1 Bro-N domain-containing protein [Candidatus Portnoybacteria bacterium]